MYDSNVHNSSTIEKEEAIDKNFTTVWHIYFGVRVNVPYGYGVLVYGLFFLDSATTMYVRIVHSHHVYFSRRTSSMPKARVQNNSGLPPMTNISPKLFSCLYFLDAGIDAPFKTDETLATSVSLEYTPSPLIVSIRNLSLSLSLSSFS
jgi:hypothetical protein